MIWLLIISVLIDQISKWLIVQSLVENVSKIVLIPNILSIEYVRNFGAVFGIMQGSNAILAVISAAICIAISVYIINCKRQKKAMFFAWYLILSGRCWKFNRQDF